MKHKLSLALKIIGLCVFILARFNMDQMVGW